jgi:hypothetical protein
MTILSKKSAGQALPDKKSKKVLAIKFLCNIIIMSENL